MPVKKRKSLKFDPASFDSLVKGMETEDIKLSFLSHIKHTLAKDQYTATLHDKYVGLAFTIRDMLMERWIKTQQTYHLKPCKRVYYLSLEYLMGRTLGNAILNLGLENTVEKVMSDLALDLEELREQEVDAGLGNGGLGRLAACFLDSMATMQIPCHGYGIRYDYGIFNQAIRGGYQVEEPDSWLALGNPWEIERPEFAFTIKFYGRVDAHPDATGTLRFGWVDTQDVLAVPFDTPIPGYRNNTVNTLRLWSAKSTDQFDLDYFNHGDYMRAVENKAHHENISKVLYPNDVHFSGKELRVKQQFFFVSASLQDIVRRFKQHEQDFRSIPDHMTIQLNDTHPAVAIPEFMRLLMDQEGLNWDTAWEITTRTFAYTNHTLLSEALETWPVRLYERLLPRHLQIIFEINHRFLKQVAMRYPGNVEKLKRMSIIQEGPEQQIRMAYLSIVGSRSVNGVAKLHTELLKEQLVRDFFEMFPERFNNKTNGITQRRWLCKCNPGLSELITGKIGDRWITDLPRLEGILDHRQDAAFVKQWMQVKRDNKLKLVKLIREITGIRVNPDTLFDVHVKRIHEYKRQLLFLLYAIRSYQMLKGNPEASWVPRTMFMGGKAAPGYHVAKLIIKLANNVSDVINRDPAMKGKLQLIFIPNYRVSLAEKIIPATDLSEQISTAGKEASGTGNMKFALNGALTIGTMDGANIEIREQVGEDNIFIFGLKTHEIDSMKSQGYRPQNFIERSVELQSVLHLLDSGFFSIEQPDLFRPLVNHLKNEDTYMLMADFDAYVSAQENVQTLFRDSRAWTEKCIQNVARMGVFSSDRTIADYVSDIWHTQPAPVEGL